MHVEVMIRAEPAAEEDVTFSPGQPAETFTDVPCGSPDGNCFQTWRQQSPTFDQIFIYAENGPTQGSGLYAFGPVLGEFWVT